MIRVGILGATGSVGQRFIQLLEGHPYFEVAALGGSDRSQGKAYGQIVQWKMTTPLPLKVAAIVVGDCYPRHFLEAGCRLVFSGLDSGVSLSIIVLIKKKKNGGRKAISSLILAFGLFCRFFLYHLFSRRNIDTYHFY